MPLYFMLILVILTAVIPVPVYPAVEGGTDGGNIGYSLVALVNISLHVTPNTDEVTPLHVAPNTDEVTPLHVTPNTDEVTPLRVTPNTDEVTRPCTSHPTTIFFHVPLTLETHA